MRGLKYNKQTIIAVGHEDAAGRGSTFQPQSRATNWQSTSAGQRRFGDTLKVLWVGGKDESSQVKSIPYTITHIPLKDGSHRCGKAVPRAERRQALRSTKGTKCCAGISCAFPRCIAKHHDEQHHARRPQVRTRAVISVTAKAVPAPQILG